MSYEFNSQTPIYLQIIEHIKIQIISKKLLPGEKISSVRDLSFEYKVNPNTVVKSLAELEELGLLITESTNGKFVTTNIDLIEKIKNETIIKKAKDFLGEMKEIGFDKSQVMEVLKKETLWAF